MKLKLGGATATPTKPATSLQEKASAHKFSLPQTKPIAEKAKADVPQTSGGIKLGGQQAEPETKTTTQVETAKPVEHDNAIPEVSEEKFNIIEGAEAEISEESGDKFREMLQLLDSNIDSEGDLQRILKGTMEYLQANPELDAILKPEDRAIFVRAARKSYGITLAAKTTRKAKTTKAAAKVDDLMDELADLDFAL